MGSLLTTPLHDQHVAQGAHLTEFAGWSMPLRYSSDLGEHTCVRTRAGLFDLSHMGEIEVRGTRYAAGKMLVFDAGEDSSLRATRPSTLMALGGEPVGERFIEWNFVSSSRERIEQAKADWRAKRMKLPDFDNQEFIPLA